MNQDTRKQKLDQYVEEDIEIAGRFRAEQINTVLRLMPVMMLIHAFVGSILIWFFRNDASPIVLWGWGIAFAIVILNNLDVWHRNRKQKIDRHLESTARMMTANAIALSLVWGIATVMLFPSADLKQQFALACVMISMMGIGAFSLATLKQAALSYVVVFTVCSICALLMTQDGFFLALSGLQGIWALAVTVAVAHHSFLFAERMMTNSIIQRKIGELEILEKDLQHTLMVHRFETDKDGFFIKIDHHFARKLGFSATELMRTPFATLLVEDPVISKNPCYRSPIEFEKLLTLGIPFRDKLVCIKSSTGTNYWRVSARDVARTSQGEIGLRGFVRLADQEVFLMANAGKSDLIYLATGMPNQKAFEKKIYQLLAINLKKTVHFSCAIVEIDNFGELLDDVGADRSDGVLKMIGERLKEGLSGRGLITHFGETGFGILCPVKNDPETILQSLSLLMMQGIEFDSKRLMPELRFGCSLGPQHGRSVSKLIAAAQKAGNMVSAADVKNWHILPNSTVNKTAQQSA